MKTIFKTMIVAAAVVFTACSGGDKKNQKNVAEITPTVAVEQVTRRDVPQTMVYSTTVEAFVKNKPYRSDQCGDR